MLPTFIPTRLNASAAYDPALRPTVPEIRAADLNRPIRFHDQNHKRFANSPDYNQFRCVPGSILSLGSPQTAFNPHTATVLAAERKSPYPHRSASDSRPKAGSLHAQHCRYGTRDLAPVDTGLREIMSCFTDKPAQWLS